MPKFTFIAEHDSGQKVTYDCDHDFLDHVLEDFDLFLRGVGFFPQGDKLQYVSDETYYDDPIEWRVPEWETPQDDIGHSEFFFDTERNK
jgi:hypothetical protein